MPRIIGEETYYTTKEAAEFLGCNIRNVKHHVYKSGYLQGMLVSPRLRLFSQTELETFRDTPEFHQSGHKKGTDPRQYWGEKETL